MRIITILNHWLMAFIMLVLFILLAIASLEQHGYKQSEIDAVNALVEAGIVKKQPIKLSQAAALAEVWGLTKEDVNKPVCLFGEEGKCI